jgi:hypothetical protein
MGGLAVVAATILTGCLSACASGSMNACQMVAPLSKSNGSIRVLPDLKLAVSTMMRAHCACDFDDEARSRMPLGVDGRGGWNFDKAQLCLGRLKIRGWAVEGDDLVSIDFALAATNGADPSDGLVVFAHLVDGRWLLSWPLEPVRRFTRAVRYRPYGMLIFLGSTFLPSRRVAGRVTPALGEMGPASSEAGHRPHLLERRSAPAERG